MIVWRTLQYEGDEEWIKNTLERSLREGKNNFGRGTITATYMDAQESPKELVQKCVSYEPLDDDKD
jgi:hypothetical protein